MNTTGTQNSHSARLINLQSQESMHVAARESLKSGRVALVNLKKIRTPRVSPTIPPSIFGCPYLRLFDFLSGAPLALPLSVPVTRQPTWIRVVARRGRLWCGPPHLLQVRSRPAAPPPPSTAPPPPSPPRPVRPAVPPPPIHLRPNSGQPGPGPPRSPHQAPPHCPHPCPARSLPPHLPTHPRPVPSPARPVTARPASPRPIPAPPGPGPAVSSTLSSRRR